LRPSYEVADIINSCYNESFRQRIPVYKQRTLSALSQCRTAALGGHIDACDNCGHKHISYNSCRNRHCPKCQGIQKEMWAIQREEEMLPVGYFHVVFTLPSELHGLCLRNPKFMYDLLFESAWYVLKIFATDDKWMGVKSAATMLLHTWGQKLSLHPHVHCIVPNGGLTKDGSWKGPKRANSNFLFPVLAMNKVYKAFFLRRLKEHLETGELPIPIDFPTGREYYNWKEILYKKEWVVYTKPPFGGAKHVVKYLARYSHRVAITNQRITSITDTEVSFNYKDYRNGGVRKTMLLTGTQFLQRFCLHILPHRFRKIRHYGFLANASKKKSLAIARVSLKVNNARKLSKAERKELAILRMFSGKMKACPCCQKGQMIIMDIFAPNKDPPTVFMNKKVPQPIY
jgi:hypothetical protein